jgi:hypothetical protein
VTNHLPRWSGFSLSSSFIIFIYFNVFAFSGVAYFISSWIVSLGFSSTASIASSVLGSSFAASSAISTALSFAHFLYTLP